MRILFITPSYKPAFVYGGTVVVISSLAESLVQSGHDVTVYTTTANGNAELPVIPNKLLTLEGVKVFYFERVTKDHTHVSFALWGHLRKTAASFDIVHIHSWWNLLVLGAAWICKRKKIKPILSPHGMFSSYILRTNNAITKKFLHRFIGKKMLANTQLHVSTQLEWDESQKIIHNWRGIIIPNLIAVPSKEFERKTNDIFTIGFLSRIDPKKGLDILIQALGHVNFTYQLLVAGDGEEKYLQSLQLLSQTVGNHKNIKWVGWKNGDEKFDFLAQLDLFSLISHSENFAIVVIESLLVGTPVLISKGVGLASYIDNSQLGWVTDIDIAQVTSHLEKAYYDKTRRQNIEDISSQLVKQHFDRFKLTERYINFYLENFIK